MAAPKIFLTGGTGYIGGDALYRIHEAHPDWEITALVRNSDRGAVIASKYPTVNLVYGSLNSADVIEEEAKKADIVYHFANCDHVASARAIAKGLAAHTSDRPGHWIHISGTGSLVFEDLRAFRIGELRDKEYNDWDGVGELTSLPDDAPHRNVDKIVIDVGSNAADRVKTAIISPPAIYGPGRGPGNTRSVQVYNLARAVLRRRKGFLVGKGENIWHEVHVHDLSDLSLALGEAAVAGGGKATWGKEGYYLAENGGFAWGDIQRAVAKVAFEQGFIKSSDVDVLDAMQTSAVDRSGPFLWGTNSRGQAIRGRKLLDWNPHRPSSFELLPDIVQSEAKYL
ncbi:hypothetical protein AJ80_03613 [Polytolypa hystricis UAMH7299]|uniref:NmrA-like domain-containing protein n=1 Tax=Polytolypa hystricis (strain UAMH7299) TaxID=1447883 RepID=A0A2B7YGE4_POLH7|nr:hypothetical protein AJ80_03613 [Polytolypa hystricis UAMH7299]